MKTYVPILLSLVVLYFNGCKQATKEPNQPMVMKMMEFKASAGDCATTDAPCYEMYIQYPEIEGGEESVSKRINASLYDTLLHSFADFAPGELGPFESFHDVAWAIETQFNDLINELEAYNQKWFFNMTSEKKLIHPQLLSVIVRIESYTGGAHGNHWINLLNFDPQSGASMSWKDVITDPIKFLNLSETAFRKARNIPAGKDLEEAGFFFENGQFILPESIGFTEEGIYSVFNPYEAGPYALGPTEYTIPWKELAPLLKDPYQSFAEK